MSDSRERFVTATTELFRRQGYNGTSVKQITAAAGLPTGSLYHFFPGGKQDLAVASLETSGEVYRQLVELIWDSADDPGSATQAFFDGAANVLEETDFIDPCPIGTVAREVASTNEQLRKTTNTVIESWVSTATNRLMAAGIGESVAHDIATCLVSTIEGGFVLARASRDADKLRTSGKQMRLLVEAAVAQAASTRGG